MEIQWQLRRACVSSLIGSRVYPSNRDCQMGIEFTRRRRAAGAAHAPSRRCDILFCLTHVIRTRAPVGRHRCRCTGRTVCAFASGRVLYTVTFPESPSRPPIAPAAVTVWPRVWLDLPSVTSIVSQLSTPMQKLPPATPWTVWAVSSHRPLPRTVGALAPAAPYLSLSLSHLPSLLLSLSLSPSLPFSCCSPSCATDCPTHPPLPVSTAPTPVPRSPSTFSPRLAGVQSSQRL